MKMDNSLFFFKKKVRRKLRYDFNVKGIPFYVRWKFPYKQNTVLHTELIKPTVLLYRLTVLYNFFVFNIIFR